MLLEQLLPRNMKRKGDTCSPKSMKKLRLAESRRITRSDNKKALQHESCLVESTVTFASSVATGKGRKRRTKSTLVVAKRTKGRHKGPIEFVVLTSVNMDGNLLLIGSHRMEKDKPPEQFKIVIPKILAYFTF
ncbi:Pyridoxal kinase-like protein [Drosera capensis]